MLASSQIAIERVVIGTGTVAATVLTGTTALGVDVLWLAPLFRAPPGDFGYAVSDYFNVRADYGSDAELSTGCARSFRRTHSRRCAFNGSRSFASDRRAASGNVTWCW